MPTYTITHTVSLYQDVTMNVNAPNESAAIDQAAVYIENIALDPGFINDNLVIELSSLEEDRPSYTPLTSPNPAVQASGYTPISSLYSTASTPTSGYTRLT